MALLHDSHHSIFNLLFCIPGGLHRPFVLLIIHFCNIKYYGEAVHMHHDTDMLVAPHQKNPKAVIVYDH